MAEVPHPFVPRPFVSVIIPVFNDGERLRLCLAALDQQTYDRSRWEAIVVDNGSDDLDLIKSVVESHDGVVLAQEPTPGSYAARNTGLTLAQGDIIAFTDADCMPAPDWLERGVGHLNAQADCGLVAGRVAVFPENPARPNLLETYDMVIGFPQEEHLKYFKGGATANLFTRRQVIDRVGPFNQSLKSFGDFEWGHRVFLAGYGQTYAADVEVQHPARQTWAVLRQKTERASGGAYDFYIKPKDTWIQRNREFLRLVIADLIPPINFALRVLKHPQPMTLKQRLGIPLVLLSLRYISALEKMRLRLGGISKRA